MLLKMKQVLLLLLCSLFILACAQREAPVTRHEKAPDILYVHVDGTMVFRGRIMQEDEVIIYNDGRGGERAAVKIYIPYKEDIFRDSITVERQTIDVTVERD